MLIGTIVTGLFVGISNIVALLLVLLLEGDCPQPGLASFFHG